ncbi:MAG: hypothetical protein GXO50_07635 [Chlorobi bacterium]|nr:hypothetical protein [Chlorobiota bacterium]
MPVKTFLYETAEKIITEHKPGLHKICLIFPNKRTKFWFRKHYARITGKISRPPEMIEIGRFIRRITEFEDEDKLSLIFELYKIFKTYDFISYSFDNFYRLGEIIISDFNEIDAWLVNPQSIYRNIKDIKEIEARFGGLSDEQKEILKRFWANFLTEKNSAEKEMFLKLWNILPEVYKQFTRKLRQKKFAYNGLIYRVLSEKTDAGEIETGKYEKYIFIGFNALNKAELKLFNFFKKNGLAEFYWDNDAYYFYDEKQEAGDFLRKNFKNLKIKPSGIPENFVKDKKIKIFGVSSKIGQAKLLSALLDRKDTDCEKNTAVIAADEGMLFPILSSLPDKIQNINVTMGFAFKLTPLYNFVVRFTGLRISAEKNNGHFYFKTVLNIIKHPYFLDYNHKLAEKIIEEINTGKITVLKPGFTEKYDDILLNLIFVNEKNISDTDKFLSDLLNILFLLFEKNTKTENAEKNLKNEYIFRAYKKIKRFREIIRENNENISLKLTADLLLQILKNDTVPFESETDKGLQIMGLMESRNLDFENVIILGLNEGNIPAISRPPTFISQSMRFAFGLPMIKYQDAVFAYFFYRALQRAKNITLIYNDVTDNQNTGEISRFITQILYETSFDITHKHLNEDLYLPRRKKIRIPVDKQLRSVLNKFIVSGNNDSRRLSASAVNTYIGCSLKFYFLYIAGLKKPEMPGDEISAVELGSILHRAAEHIYDDLRKKSSGGIITEKMIKAKISETEKYVNKALKEQYNPEGNYTPEGIHIIIKKVIENYLESLLKYDVKNAPFEIISLEADKKYETLFNIDVKGENKQVKLHGIIDRTDKKNDIYKIIDYKTGNIKTATFTLDNLFDKKNEKRNTHAFQILYYLLILSKMPDFSDKKIKPALYYLRFLNKDDYSEMPPVNINPDLKNIIPDENTAKIILPEFEEKLRKVLEEIFNDEIPFSQTENTAECKNCDFNKICF